MRFISMGCFSLAITLLVACNPTFNWRQVRTESTDLVALMPCKPESQTRRVTLAGQAVDLQMQSCETDGANFSLASAVLPDATLANDALAQWRGATLLNLRASAPKEAEFMLKGATALKASVQTVAVGQRADGLPVLFHGVWFARGNQLFSASVFAEKLSPEVTETFFTGLSLP